MGQDEALEYALDGDGAGETNLALDVPPPSGPSSCQLEGLEEVLVVAVDADGEAEVGPVVVDGAAGDLVLVDPDRSDLDGFVTTGGGEFGLGRRRVDDEVGWLASHSPNSGSERP